MSSSKDSSQFRTSGTTPQSDPRKDVERSAPTQEGSWWSRMLLWLFQQQQRRRRRPSRLVEKRGQEEELKLLKDKHVALEKENQQLLCQLQELREGKCMEFKWFFHSPVIQVLDTYSYGVEKRGLEEELKLLKDKHVAIGKKSQHLVSLLQETRKLVEERGLEEELKLLEDKHVAIEKERQHFVSLLQETRKVEERGLEEELKLLKDKHVAIEKKSQHLVSFLQKRRKVEERGLEEVLELLEDKHVAIEEERRHLVSLLQETRKVGKRGLEEELKLLKDKHVAIEKERKHLVSFLQKRSEVEERGLGEVLKLLEDKHVAIEKESQHLVSLLQETRKVEERGLEEVLKLLEDKHVAIEKESQHLVSLLQETRKIKLSGSANQQQSSSEQVGYTTKFEELGGQFSVPSNLHIRCPVGGNGGLLTIPNTDISLDIPEGALKEERTIDFRAIHENSQNSEDESFTTNSCVMVELLPNCLQLSAPAKLTLPHCLILSQGVKTTAKVFESHSMKDGKPVWEENCNIQNEVDDSTCHLWITQFCWIKVHINGKTVKAKRIYIFAAKSDKSTREITNMEVGYYVKIPTAGKIITDNSLQVLQKKEFVFEKEGSKPLRLSFEEILPSSYWDYSVKKKNPQEISFRSVALSQESSRSFPLIAKTGQNWVDSFCYFTAGQGLEEIDLACFLADPDKEQPSLSKRNSIESMDPNVPRHEASGVVGDTTNEGEEPGSKLSSDNAVSEETIRELSEQIGSSCICVARALGLTKTQIENIKGSNTQQQEISYQVLSKWKETNGFSATKSALVTALQNAGRKDLADNLEKPDNNQATENQPGNEKT